MLCPSSPLMIRKKSTKETISENNKKNIYIYKYKRKRTFEYKKMPRIIKFSKILICQHLAALKCVIFDTFTLTRTMIVSSSLLIYIF